MEEVLGNIIREREEELLTGEKIVQLKELEISSNNLSEVDDQLMARAVVRIQTVNLYETRLTTVQVTTLLQTILAEEELVLESLDITGTNLGKIDSQLLARGLVRIKTVNLVYTSLTTVQVTTLL